MNFITKSLLRWFAVVCVLCILSICIMENPRFERILYGSRSQKEKFIEIDDIVSEQLKSEIRLVCWVMTCPDNHATKAHAVKETWGKRCNTLLFVSSAEDPVLNTIVLPGEEGRSHLWEKTSYAFSYIYDHHMNDTDWVLKADDDTYVVVENLRYMLRSYSPYDAIWFGCKFQTPDNHTFMSGGAGYVLSREAVRRFVKLGMRENICDDGQQGVEDLATGICLKKLNVTTGNSLDDVQAQRFLPFPLNLHLIPNFYEPDNWYWQYRVDGSPDVQVDNCSKYIITFHYIEPADMRVFDYLLYDVTVYGRTRYSRPLVDRNLRLNP